MALHYVQELCNTHKKGCHIPYLALILQLLLGPLLSKAQAAPVNENEIETWHDNMVLLVPSHFEVEAVLEKV